MKNQLIAAATLAALGAAHAQSSVVVFGILDASVSQGRGSVSNFRGLRSSGLATSQIGFRGVEDLGGGLKAGFWLESEILTDLGAGLPTNTNNQATGFTAATSMTPGGLTFNRRSTVSLSGPWGQLILGRDYHTLFWNNAAFDPFGLNGAGTSQTFLSRVAGGGPLNPATGPYMNAGNGLSTRASNSIAYAYGFAPNGQTIWGTGGLYAHLMHFRGENASNAPNSDDGTGSGLRLGYIDGPLNTAVSYMRTAFVPSAAPTGALGNITSWSVAGSWDFGPVKPRASYFHDSFGPRDGRGWLLGATSPVGVGEARLSYSTYRTSLDAGSSKLAVGYVHHLSKRTALYGTLAGVRNTGGASQAVNGAVTGVNARSSGWDLGMRHFF
jgi:predicted porin